MALSSGSRVATAVTAVELPQAEVAGRRDRVCITAGLGHGNLRGGERRSGCPTCLLPQRQRPSSALHENTPDALVMAAAGTVVTGSASAGPGSGRAGLDGFCEGARYWQ